MKDTAVHGGGGGGGDEDDKDDEDDEDDEKEEISVSNANRTVALSVKAAVVAPMGRSSMGTALRRSFIP